MQNPPPTPVPPSPRQHGQDSGLITLPASLLPTWVVTKPCGQGTPPKGNLGRWPLVSSPSTYCVTLGEERVFSEPQFLHLFNGGSNLVPRDVALMSCSSQLRPQEGTPGYQGPPGLPDCLGHAPPSAASPTCPHPKTSYHLFLLNFPPVALMIHFFCLFS